MRRRGKGPCNIYCITGPVRNHFWNKKKSRPLRSQLGKNHRTPANTYMKKSVGLGGALTVDHSLIQLASGDAVSPPPPQRVQGRSLVGVQGAKPQEAPKILHHTIPK